ncbi:MAG: ADP-ribosylation factor-like protein [Candidatus Hermodarchaeota archaeon]
MEKNLKHSILYLKKEEEEQKPEPSKLLFTGLDDAGKTSIILSLQREFSKIAVLSPTRGAQRRVFDFLGKEIAEWDLGGQISYRISYLKNPGKFFDGTEIAIYVIDIQNKPRIPEAISYFKDVIKQFKELEIEPPIYVFLHKLDPALRRGAPNEMQNLIIDLKEQVKKSTEYKDLYFYETSIYDFSSIIRAMSEILLSLYPKSELIEKTIIEFAKKIDSEGVVVIDDNSLIIGSYYKNDETKHLLSASTPYFLTLSDSLQYTGVQENRYEDRMILQRFGKNFIFKQITLKKDATPYYLLLLKDDPVFQKEDLETFANIMKEILYI